MNQRTAIIPAHTRPTTVQPHEAGTTWVVESVGGDRLATIYRSDDGDHGADLSGTVGRHSHLLVGGGLPRLPLTRPDDYSTGPLTWEEIAGEVQAVLESDGWDVALAQAPKEDR